MRDAVADRRSGQGLRGSTVVAFESRRAAELGALIRRHGGVPVVAPSLREVPLDENPGAVDFLRRLELHEVDVVIVLTAVGVRTLARVSRELHPPEHLAALLGATTLVARGPKPIPELRKLGLAPQVRVGEPNTWREVLAALDGEAPLAGRRVAILEHGAESVELAGGLAARGAEVVSVPLYRWALPEDQRPLRAAVSMLARAEADVALFTSGAQIDHVMLVADQLGLGEAVLRGAGETLVASVGPVCSQALRRHGLVVGLEPSHPKMGHLVVALARELGERSAGPDAMTAGDRGTAAKEAV